MESKSSFNYHKVLDSDFESVVENVKSLLAEEKFGIVTETNVQEKIKAKTGKEINKYLILGACNPGLAYEAIQIESRIGVMLPCNVLIRETDDHKIEVAAINPMKTIMNIGKPEMEPLAIKAEKSLRKMIDSL